MLETKNLCKKYKPKKGVPVTAIDHVSLRFPEKGMVFLLGKSGSGKSTMLNLLGGLDKYDDGEIIIKGISSKDFSQQRFDSYRNTYVGFIFQEYNVLEEFTVGANIALAIELQGRKADDETLNRILHDVDLDGYGSRKPNELSGGQKQRVAIARALVKNPEIIMADEPTGALDSATGRQVLDTLKKLSADKLVIIVSHDREYAERYADRIIELADGKVIRDVEATHETAKPETEEHLVFRASTIEVPSGYHLTEEDREQINAYIDSLKSGVSITIPNQMRGFRDTDTESIPVQDGSDFKLIKSKLPLKSAAKIGASSLKHKRFRLVMTILLSVAAFSMFAMVDTFSAYNHIRSCTDSILDTGVNYLTVQECVKKGKGLDAYWSTQGLRFTEEELKKIGDDIGIPMRGVYVPENIGNSWEISALSFDTQYSPEYVFTETGYHVNLTDFRNVIEVDDKLLSEMHCTLKTGRLPDGTKDEIAISTVVLDSFAKAGYTELVLNKDGIIEYGDFKNVTEDGETSRVPNYQKISKPEEMIGKTLMLFDKPWTITGVVDTGFDASRYESVAKEKKNATGADTILNMVLYEEWNCAVNYSLAGSMMVGKGKINEIINASPKIKRASNGNLSISGRSKKEAYFGVWGEEIAKLKDIPAEDIIWLDGKQHDTLADNEFVVSAEQFTMSDTAWEDVFESENIEKTLSKKFSEYDEITAYCYLWDEDSNSEEIEDAKIVGIIKDTSAYHQAMAVSEKYMNLLVADMDGIYQAAIGAMPENRADVEKVVRYCYREGKDVTSRYEINNPVTFELDSVNDFLKVFAKIFLYIGIGLALFASLLMSNFISQSIIYKRQEIGILRAIGSRSADVFRIFFSESFIIAMINFVISSVICGVGVAVLNRVLRHETGVLVTVLHFGLRQILLLFVISVAIAAIASFIPVRKIAAKKPIDAIRGR